MTCGRTRWQQAWPCACLPALRRTAAPDKELRQVEHFHCRHGVAGSPVAELAAAAFAPAPIAIIRPLHANMSSVVPAAAARRDIDGVGDNAGLHLLGRAIIPRRCIGDL